MTTQELDLVLNHPEAARAGLADGMSVEQIVSICSPGKCIYNGTFTPEQAKVHMVELAKGLLNDLEQNDYTTVAARLQTMQTICEELNDWERDCLFVRNRAADCKEKA